MKNSDIDNPLFREAVKAIESGNIAALQQLLEVNPDSNKAIKHRKFLNQQLFIGNNFIEIKLNSRQ